MGSSVDPFLFWKPGQSIHGALRFGSSTFATAVRAGAGAFVVPLGPRPERRLVLYGLEACPGTRKVREALSMLDLDADVRPCPKGGRRYRDELREHVHVKDRIPVLVDPNTAEVLAEPDAIVAYLFERYGAGPVPLALRPGRLGELSSTLATMARRDHGVAVRPSRKPDAPLELWSYEASPYCRFVREALDELEIPYVLHNVARESPRRAEFVARVGKMQVPYLVDPNTKTEMFENERIIAYLRKTYGTPATGNEREKAKGARRESHPTP